MATIKKYIQWTPQISSDGKTQVQIYGTLKAMASPSVTVDEETRNSSFYSHYQGNDSRRIDRLISDDTDMTVGSDGNPQTVLDYVIEHLRNFNVVELTDGATGTAIAVASYLSPTRTTFNSETQVNDTVNPVSWDAVNGKVEQTITQG